MDPIENPMEPIKENEKDNITQNPDTNKKTKLNPKRRYILTGLLIILAICISIPTSVWLMNYQICNKYTSYIYDVSNVPADEVAIVLGSYVDEKGNLSEILFDRVNKAVDLYKTGKVKKILMSGDHGRLNYDEVNSMRKVAYKKGVPSKDIFMDHAGFNTYETMYRAKTIFEVKSAIIVTQKYHLYRALYIARQMGIDAKGVNSDPRLYMDMDFYESREVLARVKAFIQVNITHPKPKYLGTVIPITGDGRATCDTSED